MVVHVCMHAMRCSSFTWLCFGRLPCNEVARITSPLTSCNPTSPSSSCLTPSVFTLLPKHHHSEFGMYASAARNFHCIFRHFSKNKGCFVGALFHSLHQLFLSGSHLSQLMTPPVPSHRKWGIRMTRGGYEKGICFTAVGDKITEGSPGDRKRMKKRQSTWGNEIWDVEKNC